MANDLISKGATASFIEYNLAQLQLSGKPEDDHSLKLAKNGLYAIVDYATKNGEKLNDYSAPSVVRTVETIKELGLNLALPNMGYIVVYNVGGVKDVRVAPFKNGYREIFQNYGDDVKKIHAIWEVRKGDVFKAPKWVGIKMTEAEYEQKTSYGKVEKVVLVYETLGGEVKYLFAERNNVIPSLIGIVRKYGGQTKQTSEIIDKIKELDDLDKAYEYVLKNAPQLLSPAYKDHFDQMVVTKMINWIVRNHPISDRKATPQLKKALEDVLDMDFEDVTNLQDKKVNDKNLEQEIKNGNVGGTKVTVTEEPNVSNDFVEKDEPIVVNIVANKELQKGQVVHSEDIVFKETEKQVENNPNGVVVDEVTGQVYEKEDFQENEEPAIVEKEEEKDGGDVIDDDFAKWING